MTYAELILNLRNQVGDTRRRFHVDWVSDGSSTVFQMPQGTFPVLEQAGTYVVKINSVAKTEGTDYTIDKEAGTIVLTVAATNNYPITIDGSSVHLTDAGWLSIINSVIYSLGDDFWKEFVDETGFTTTAGMLSLSLVATQPNCIAVYEFQHRQNSGVNWNPVEEYTNWRYDRDNNIIYLGDVNSFGTDGQPLRIRGLKKYTIGSLTSSTLDVQDKFMTIIEYGSIARYWRWRYKSVVELVSKITQENTRTPLQELIMLSDRFDRLYEIEKGKLKPQKPARIIPPYKVGGGRP